MSNLYRYEKFINIVKYFTTGNTSAINSITRDINWIEIFQEFQNHSITTLAIDSINVIEIPEDIKKMWKEDIIKQVSYITKLLHAQNDISNCLDSYCVNWSVLKGSSAALYYPNPYQRAFGDIDILVAENDYDKATELLSNIGFSFGRNIYKYDRHITARKNSIALELHHFFANTRSNGKDRILNDLLFNSLPNCRTETIGNFTFKSLPDLEMGIVLIAHIHHHLRTGIGLRQILDFIMYTEKVLDDNFWNSAFKSVARSLGYETLCKAVVRIGQLYFGLCDSILWCKDIDDSIAIELLELALDQGDLGNKSTRDFNPTIRVLNKLNEGFFNFIKYEHASGMKNWKLAQKIKLLEPFAWIYGVGRHIGKTLMDKGGIANLYSNKLKSKKQSSLLDKINKSN